MPRTVYYAATSLTGQLADEQSSLQWLFDVEQDENLDASMAEFMAEVGVLVEGSSTYLWVLEHEQLLEHPEKWGEYYGDRPTFVFTSRDLPRVPDADIRFVSGDVTDVFPRLLEAAGDGDVWVVGGGDLAGQFIDAGLLDEIRVTIAPVALTGGAPLLPRTITSERLRLTDVTQRGQFVELTYRVGAPTRDPRSSAGAAAFSAEAPSSAPSAGTG